MKKYNLAVYIGRFQPYHNGHVKVIEDGLKIADRVLVLVGSSNSPRTEKNPFTFEERKEILVDIGGSVEKLSRIVKENGGIDYAYQQAREYSERARGILNRFENKEVHHVFNDFFDQLIDRHFWKILGKI